VAPVNGAFSVIRPGQELPYGTEVIAAATRSPASVVVLGANPGDVPEGRILELLTGPFGIGAVVPAAAGPDQAGLPQVARDVDAEGCEVLAVRADVVGLAPIDPRAGDPRVVIAAALDAARAQGLRVVSEPDWTSEDARDVLIIDEAVSRVLIITGELTNDTTRTEERAVRELIRSLSAQSQHNQLTVLAVEQPGPAAAPWRAEGVRVIGGPPDWEDLATREAGSFSHVVVTASGLRSPARRWIEMAQPQAAKLLFLSSLPFREVAALVPITRVDEMTGLELVRIEVEARVAEQVRWADGVWCENERDASFVRGLLPEKPVVVIPSAIEPACAPVPLSNRRGVVIAALEGHDVISANEDAALRALEEVLPELRKRQPSLDCTVLSNWPTPMLEAAVQAAGGSISPASELTSVLASARVLLAAHGYGTGQAEVIMSSLAAGTPFIVTPQAAAGLDLGVLRSIACFSDVSDMAARAIQLLTDDAVWHNFSTLCSQVLSADFGTERRTAVVRAALAPLGITPAARMTRWPPAPAVVERVPRRKPPWVALRPGITTSAPPPPTEPESERDRYASWVASHGPTPEVLRALREDLQQLPYRPLISVLVPVYNTASALLLDAIDSVRAQIYDRWQLCIADDGSTNPETLEVLASLAGDPSVQVVDLPGGSGISEATNAALSLADGEFIALLDHDDLLKPHALAQVVRWLNADPGLDVIYSDEDKLDGRGSLYDPHLKPDWSPDQLTAQNYVCHLTVARRTLVERIGGFRSAFDGSQDYDLILRLTEQTDQVAHIPEPLYSWRAVPGSAAAVADAKPYAIEAAQRALSAAQVRRGYDGRVDTTAHLGCFRVRYPLPGQPRVSIIIPTRNGVHLLRRCVDSVLERSTYRNYEFLIIDNQSTDGETLGYLADFPGRVIRYPHRFNYARMMNLAARFAECDAMLFLNNDTEVISHDWIESLLEHAMRPEVGAVGCRLFFDDGEPQHEGILVGVGGWALNLNHRGYWARGDIVRNVSAVTGACTMIRPEVFWRVGGNDERLRVAYNDVDLCLRIRQAGYQVVYTPAAELYHFESSSRGGYEHYEDGPLFGIRWHPKERIDPYYSPVLDPDRPFQIKV
jgi:GT2 family glycosyltransferase